jgi:hypothetical protein
MSSDNRGLASADEETRERVARKGGEASHGGGAGGDSSGHQGQGGEGRGFDGMSEEERKRKASKGGQH